MTNNNPFLLSPVPFGPLDYWAAIINFPHLVDLNDHYLKQSLRNRINIATSQGLLSLTIPIEKPKPTSFTKDIKIDYRQPWIRQHLRSLKTAYNQAPYFSYYFEFIEGIYFASFKFLIDFNLASMDFIANHCDVKLVTNRDEIDHTHDFIDIRPNPPFRKKMQLFSIPAYYQCFIDKTGFMRDVSVLDLLFLKGPETRVFLKNLNLLPNNCRCIG
ncbi:MAG: hypothetical protein KatS3mg034_0020 [Vicingaceae bacterium]|nr:MAG: hypothetical protein KatS3mg034_0020 [Vicingaceae bacterium]